MKQTIFVALFYVLLSQVTLHAQMFSSRGNQGMNSMGNTSDTSHKAQTKTNDSIAIFYTLYRDSTHYTVNRSTLPSFTLNPWCRDLGNFGTAYSSLLFEPTIQSGRTLGMQNKSGFLLEQSSCRFYNTTRPFTNITYSMGTKQEQFISLLHTQNVKPNWNFAMSYAKLVSPGQFKFLRSNHDQAMINTWYESTNKRYQLKAAILYNKLQQDENGGLVDESLLANPSYTDRRLIPVFFSVSNFSRNRSSVLNYYRNASLQLYQTYNIGQKRNQNAKGTAFKLSHHFYTDLVFQYYKDTRPDSSYYRYVFEGIQANSDSLYDNHYLTRYGNSFSLQKEIRIRQSYAQLETGYGVENDRVTHQQNRTSYLNQYVFAELLKLKETTKAWYYQALTKFYFSGNASANMEIHSFAGRSLPYHLGDLKIGFDQSIQSPSYKNSYYHEMNIGSSSLKKSFISKLFFIYSIAQRNFSVSANQYTLSQYTYVDTNWQLQQYSTAISIQQLQLTKTFSRRTLHLENNLIVQSLNNSSPLHLPLFLTHQKLYYSDSVFKHKLALETGVAFTYNSPFKNDNYIPLFQSFAPQYQRTIYNIPMLSAFFNFGLKKFNASLALDEIQQLYAVNNLNYTSYARPNFMLRFRLNWVFIN